MNRYLHSLYCDDIRYEQSGKVTFVGVYNQQMLLPSFETPIAKLCMVLTVVTPNEKPLRKLTFRILRDEQLLASMPVNESDLTNPILDVRTKSKPPLAGSTAIRVFSAHCVLSPLKFDGPCKLRVRADTEDEELKAPALDIALIPPAEG